MPARDRVEAPGVDGDARVRHGGKDRQRRPKRQSERSRSHSGATKEGDRRLPYCRRSPSPGRRSVAPVLDPEHVGERDGEPSLGERGARGPGRTADRRRRRRTRPRRVRRRIAARPRDGRGPRRPAPSDVERCSESRGGSAARSRRDRRPRRRATAPRCPARRSRRRDPARARSGEPRLDDAHPRLAHAIGGRAAPVVPSARRCGVRATVPRRCASLRCRKSTSRACRRDTPWYSSRSSRYAMSNGRVDVELADARRRAPSRARRAVASSVCEAQLEAIPARRRAAARRAARRASRAAATDCRCRTARDGAAATRSSGGEIGRAATSRSTRSSGTRSSGVSAARAASLKQRANSSTRSRAIVTPAAAAVAAEAHEQVGGSSPIPACRSKRVIERPDPFPSSPSRRDEHGRAAELLDDARRDDADHARMPALLGEHDAVRRRRDRARARARAPARASRGRSPGAATLSSSSSRAIGFASCSSAASAARRRAARGRAGRPR